ncbi:hypothetical protein QAD02_000534 [Eretmocerus hayati]|uniref:Uncharacterized protein n=1 Tax=Eretmocerus hayati TaxID=131215 RepID=A0ACC2NDP5_9HYME|nr:hypothetical protein QAD02_000534 [Eretmocerus hayati]
MEGIFNHIFFNGVVPLVGRKKAMLWPLVLHMVAKQYHGETFEGNACRKMIQEADKLLHSDMSEDVGKVGLIPFVNVFKSWDKIVSNFFVAERVISRCDLNEHLQDFRSDFLSTGVSDTLKVHIAINHLADPLELLNNDRLGTWSEQAGESIHRDFLVFWERHQVNSMDNDVYLPNLKKQW